MSDDPAKPRFMAIQSLRWIGMALVMVALLILNGKIGGTREGGVALFLLGLFCALLAPTILARRWKSPPK